MSSGVIRPSGTTAVASMKVSPGPRLTMPPIWARCHGWVWPLEAEYWQRGASEMRFCRVRLRIFNRVKSLGIEAPDGWGVVAVPEGGS